MSRFLKICFFSACLFTAFVVKADEEGKGGFVRNRGQWKGDFLFMNSYPGADFFIQKKGFTYNFYDQQAIADHFGHGRPGASPATFRNHSVKVIFEGAGEPFIEAAEKLSTQYNFFLGRDRSRWKSDVGKYRKIKYRELYPGIDLDLKAGSGYSKYDFIVSPGANPSNIKIKYEGADKISLDNGSLVVKTSLGEIIEFPPVCWQEINGIRKEISCRFNLEKNTVGFIFPKGYDKTATLIIDPTLVFSSYSGSVANNFGMTATYDTLGHLYAGGIAFSGGYPVTPGAYDLTFNSTSTNYTDVVLSKYSPDGTSLIFSTYLGGSNTETVSSLVVNNNNELYAYGVTSSPDFPVLANAYDTTFKGGDTAEFVNNGAYFLNGTDIYVVHFNPAGSALLGATLIGGTENDGLNYNTSNLYLIDSLNKNYGDILRGEIIVDTLGNCYIASSTNSSDFPTATPFQATFGGKQDAVIFKMNPGLTSLLFSSYLGGTEKDAGYSVKLDKYNQIVMAGGTSSSNLPSTPGTLYSNYQGGQTDGYVAVINPAGNSLAACSYFGTSSYDQCYFVETDKYGDIYLFGQSLGNFPISPGVYANPGSAQFITKINNSLTSSFWLSRIGNGNGQLNLSPTAFLVDKCLNIYISGWGGSIPVGAPVTNMPITSDAFQPTTDGYNFYLAAYSRNMANLEYATYFGGPVSHEHVDGGTSRFDKNGVIYQSVCAGCSFNNDFPTTPGVVSDTNGSSCNNGVFKFNFDLRVEAKFTVSDTNGCIPFTFQFTNQSSTATTYLWDFGNGDTTSTEYNPIRTFTSTGTHQVYLIITDTVCNLSDTFVQNIHAFLPVDLQVTPDTLLCDSISIPLTAYTGLTANNFLWSSNPAFTDTLNPGGDSTILSGINSAWYYVEAGNPGCKDTDSVFVSMHPVAVKFDTLAELCLNDTTLITFSNLIPSDNISITWQNPSQVTGGNGVDSFYIAPTGSGYVVFQTVNQHGCVKDDSVHIEMANFDFLLNVMNDTIICSADSLEIFASNNGAGAHYIWSDSPFFTDTINTSLADSTITVMADTTITYYVKSSVFGCTQKDSLRLTYAEITVDANDVTICEGSTAIVKASGTNYGSATSFIWSPASEIPGPLNLDSIIVSPQQSTGFLVTVSNPEGCSDQDSAYVFVKPYTVSTILADPDTIFQSESSTLTVNPSGAGFQWTPNDDISPVNGNPVEASPAITTLYTVEYFDQAGCRTQASIELVVLDIVCKDPYIYIPNAFTPNGDGNNDVLFVRGRTIESMNLMIYDRWGNLVFRSTDPKTGWDGYFNGKPVDPAVFVYHLQVNCPGGLEYFKKGNITVIR